MFHLQLAIINQFLILTFVEFYYEGKQLIREFDNSSRFFPYNSVAPEIIITEKMLLNEI